jgi:hypothetical protein
MTPSRRVVPTRTSAARVPSGASCRTLRRAGRRRAAGWVLGIASTLTFVSSAPLVRAAPDDARDVFVRDIGDGWEIVDEQAGSLGSFTRTWAGRSGELSLTGFPVTDPPGVEALFAGLNDLAATFTVVPEPRLTLAAWLVPEGGEPGDLGFTGLTFASTSHLFTITLTADDGTGFDGPAFTLAVAEFQIDAAGGPPLLDDDAEPRLVDDSELLPLLPVAPPARYGLPSTGMTMIGTDQLELTEEVVPEVAEFLNKRTKNVVRVWGREGLTVGIGINEYPYEIFAAAALGTYDIGGEFAIDPERRALLRGAVTFGRGDSVGIVFRRDDRLVLVLSEFAPPESEATAIALALDVAGDVAGRLPDGSSGPYEFPDAPSRIAGVGLTALVVVVGLTGSRTVASVRARKVRRSWAGLEPPLTLPPPSSPPTDVVDLDPDASALRRSGRLVAVVQMLTVIVGIVALAGDFRLPGVFVAAASLVVGLVFSRWWVRRELGLLGPSATAPAVARPRPLGALTALAAFVVLGFGVAYLLKGIRYLIFDPTLAHLRWSDLLGASPRAVGVIFTIGGFVVTVIGSSLYRTARSVSRAGARQVLAADRRAPALYLRSFADDSLSLPTISSARRPLFELFSLRGADPFEEAVAWELSTYAPVVAVGRPGAALWSLGAAREHLDQASWRDDVAHRMDDAQLLVLAPGETEGLAWELGAIVRGRHLGKTIFVFPPSRPDDLWRRWQHTSTVLRDAGAVVGHLDAPAGKVHTVRVADDGRLRATVASTRDEATYRAAVDRAAEPVAPIAAPPPLLDPTPHGAP